MRTREEIKGSREYKTSLFVMKHIQDVKDIGILKGGFELTKIGKGRYKKLIQSGFKPTDKEFDDALKFIYCEGMKKKR